MQRLTRFLKQAFGAPGRQELSATASEITLHDAPRIGAGQVQNEDLPALRPIGVRRYRSESDLHDQWHRLDHALHPTANLTVILVLGDFLRGNLRQIVRRPRRTQRLVIVPHAGHWPGSDSFGDLALSPGSLGWNSIELCRDLREVPVLSATASGVDEQLILVLPPNIPVLNVM